MAPHLLRPSPITGLLVLALQGHSQGILVIPLKNLSFSLVNMSSWLSPVPVLSVELSAGLTGIVAVVVAGATMGSWFLLKMFLMVAKGAAGERGREQDKHPRSSDQGPGDIPTLKTTDVSPSAAQQY